MCHRLIMDIAGFAVGVVSIAGLFTTFFEIYETIHTLKDMGESLEQEKERIRLEAERVRYIKEKYDLDRFDEDSKRLLDMILQMLNSQLVSIKSLIARYCPELRDDELGTAAAAPATATEEQQAAPSGATVGRRKGVLNRLRWAAGDKDALGRIVDKLHYSTNTLYSFATSEAEKARNDFLLRAQALRTPELAAMMDPSQYPGIAKAARVKQLLQSSTRGVSDLQGQPSSRYAAVHQIPVSSIRWHNKDDLSQAVESPWATGSRGTESVLVEWRRPFMAGAMALPAAARRLDGLCELLLAMHEAEQDGQPGPGQGEWMGSDLRFGTLRCVGWTLASELSTPRIGLVFQYCPSWHTTRPSSLRDRISASRNLRVPVPPLDQRFDLALGITSAVSNVLAVGWAHRAVRSENILSTGVGNPATSQTYLVGFTYTRPGDISTTEFSDLPQGRDWALYRLPVSSGATIDDSDIFDDEAESPALAPAPQLLAESAAHDLYGLGIVLLEIGHWTTAQRMSRAKGIDGDLRTFQERELPVQVEKLAARCGTIYQSVVRKCLNPANWEPDSLEANLAGILQSLKLCQV